MVQALLDAGKDVFSDYEWSIVPVRFSRGLDESGKFQLRKIAHLTGLVYRIMRVKVTRRPAILYYTPAGPTLLAICRDIIVLCLIRPFFARTVFHFHAAGVSDAYPRLPRPIQYLFRRAYWHADLGIKVSAHAPDDPQSLHARTTAVVPNGVADTSRGRRARSRPRQPQRLLYVGLLSDSKGILVLLEAFRRLRSHGFRVELECVGNFESTRFEQTCRRFLVEHDLVAGVDFSGVLLEGEKARAYAGADVLCVPTFFESESFGLVAIEAMSFGLPVVATAWRGLVDVIADGETGLLVAPRDPEALTEALVRILDQPREAESMGARGRSRYERLFTLDRHLQQMRAAFESLATDGAAHR
jgi:glycosyltransferase involved in cell wall biosynthesis